MSDTIKIALVSGGLSVAVALFNLVMGLIRSRINKKNINMLKEQLQASEQNYYVVCDHCGKKIYLRNAQINIDMENTEWQTAAARAKSLSNNSK